MLVVASLLLMAKGPTDRYSLASCLLAVATPSRRVESRKLCNDLEATPGFP